jgi:hypothetical protein
MSTLVQMQVFHEIAMELGAEEDLQNTAKKALSAYLHKLGCLAGMIMRADLPGETGRMECVVTVPRNLINNNSFKEVSAKIHDAVSLGGVKPFLDSLPIIGVACGTNYYIMEMTGFGMLLLLKNDEPFDQAILHGIDRLNQKLAQACLACLYTDRLEATVRERTKDLQEANKRLTESLANIKVLSGLLPICATCKNVRDDKGYWSQVESYISSRSEATFSHGICPDCIKKFYPGLAEENESSH